MTDEQEESAAPAPPGDRGPRVRITAAQFAAWGFAFLLLRVFAVSGYDWDTAFLVSTTLGLDDGLALLFGSLMAHHLLTAVLLACVLPLLVAAALWGPRGHRRVVTLIAILGTVALAALTMSFGLWWPPLTALAVLGVIFLVRRLPPAHRLRRTVATALARVGLVAGLATLVVAAVVETPWVPHERITTTDGTVSGYVLSIDSGYLNVLTDDQDFVIVLSESVLARR